MKVEKKIIYRIYIFLSLMFFVALSLIFILLNSPGSLGVGGAGNHIVELYFADNISPAQSKIIERFNKEYNDRIRVIPINLPFETISTNERKELLSRSLRSKNNRIDILAVDYIWLGRFAKWAEPLDDFMEKIGEDIFFKYALEACTYDGKIVSMPFYIDIGIMFYRKDLIEELPNSQQLLSKLKSSITWEEFIALGQEVSDSSIPFYVFPGDHYEGLICSFMETIVSQNTFIELNDIMNSYCEEAKVGLQLLIDLIEKYKLSPPNVTDFKENEAYTYAFENNALFIRGWPGNQHDFHDRYPEIIKNLGIAALPHFKKGMPAFVYGGWNLMVSASSEHKMEAFEFLKFVSNTENQMILYDEMGLLPANQAVYHDSVFVSTNPDLIYLRGLLEHGFHRPMLDDYTKKSDIISYYLNQALSNKMSADEALESAYKMIKDDKVLIR